jgi:hypothetical protein
MGSGTYIDEDGRVDSDEDELQSDGEHESTIVMNTDDDDDIAVDISQELNVDELVAKLDASDEVDAERKRAVKRRLERLAEKRDMDLDSTYNFNLAED